jgi:hypothetical protein
MVGDLTAGYNLKEISQRNHLQQSRHTSLRLRLQRKAVLYLYTG